MALCHGESWLLKYKGLCNIWLGNVWLVKSTCLWLSTSRYPGGLRIIDLGLCSYLLWWLSCAVVEQCRFYNLPNALALCFNSAFPLFSLSTSTGVNQRIKTIYALTILPAPSLVVSTDHWFCICSCTYPAYSVTIVTIVVKYYWLHSDCGSRTTT